MSVRRILAVVSALAVVLGAGVLAVALSGAFSDEEGEPLPGRVLLAAGDIAECELEGDEATAAILAQHPEAEIATLGDNAYQQGTLEQFRDCYEPSWGRFKDRTHPAPGNHDYSTTGAAGYFEYFGDAAGDPEKGYYSYDVGPWHVVSLNSECRRVGGCGPDDAQAQWLRQDLAEQRSFCTLAYFHHPPFSSGRYGDNVVQLERARVLFEILYEHGVEVLLVGHEHSYERFAPMNPAGERDDRRGLRLFVVGTGGGNLRKYRNPPLPTTQVRDGETWGVLKLDLRPADYDWEFLPAGDGTFTDSGSDFCH